ncbi:hypothetical protein LCGC14_0425850, partial [marine sediment metagenome]
MTESSIEAAVPSKVDEGSTPFPRTVIKQLRAFDPAQQLYVA